MNAKTHYEAGLSSYILNAKNKNVMVAINHFKEASALGYKDAFYFLGRILTLGDNVSVDYQEAIHHYQAGIKLNSAKCIYALGIMYQSGLGVIKNEQIALQYFESAYQALFLEAKNEDPVSRYILGTYYYYGFFVKPSIFQAMDFFLAASNQGLSDASYMIGMIYESQAEDDKQRELAKTFYEKAALMNHPYALYALSMTAIEEENYKKAILLLEKASKEQYPLAIFSLGMIYHEKFPKLETKAFECFIEAAKQGHTESEYYTGLYYQMGKGVKKDLDQAVDWYKKAALKHEKNALYHLAMILIKSEHHDQHQTFVLLEEAAKQDHPNAQYNLAVMYQKGDGTEIDMEKSIYWYQKAANAGIPMAEYNLGMLYFEGKFIEKDELKAKSLWESASKKGYEPAVKLMFSINNYEKLQKSNWQN
jgi:uncharacterized protein